ncbi:MAG: hypothetical protein IH988_03190 [Planctomycetes bacterium]|nr:hypothetical protein [Planctomycetota bacterium]
MAGIVPIHSRRVRAHRCAFAIVGVAAAASAAISHDRVAFTPISSVKGVDFFKWQFIGSLHQRAPQFDDIRFRSAGQMQSPAKSYQWN